MNGIRLTSIQRAGLERQLDETDSVRVYRRTLAVLEYDAGIPIVRIAESMGVARRSVHRWVASYCNNLSPGSLMERPRSGRPRLWSQADTEWLEAVLEMSPEVHGYPAVNWTVPLLREHFYQSTGQVVSEDTLRRSLEVLGYVWKRPRYVLAADPDREKKKRNPAENPGVAAS
jgi:transposase